MELMITDIGAIAILAASELEPDDPCSSLLRFLRADRVPKVEDMLSIHPSILSIIFCDRSKTSLICCFALARVNMRNSDAKMPIREKMMMIKSRMKATISVAESIVSTW